MRRHLVILAGTLTLLAGCGSPQVRNSVVSQRAEVDPKYGVTPSPRVVETSRPRKGGGRYQVGKPYKIAGKWYRPAEDPNYRAKGRASWYGRAFHGRLTANGEVFDMNSLSAAHTTMPLPSYARVTNLANGHSVVVRVNDRGPFHGNRVIDVSKKVADVLDFRNSGVTQVAVEYVGRADLAGSDDAKLAATARVGRRPMSAERLAKLDLPVTPGAGAVQIAAAAPAPVMVAAPVQTNPGAIASAPGVLTAPSTANGSLVQQASLAPAASAPVTIEATTAFAETPPDLWVGYFRDDAHASDFTSLLSTYGQIMLQPVTLNGAQVRQMYLRPATPALGRAALQAALGAGAKHAKLIAR